MVRTKFINDLIEKNGYKKYLEIGVDDPNSTFNHVNANRIGVDPYNDSTGCHAWNTSNKIPLIDLIDGEFHQMTSNEYFDSIHHKTKFDLIFIDGMHTEQQVLKDIENSLKHLSKGGTILVDDVFPQSEFEAVENPKPGQPWRGTVYRAWWLLRMTRSDLTMYTNKETGLGVITKGAQILYNPDLIDKMSYAYFANHHKEILNLK